MKAKDLMIGDWIVNNEFDRNEICQLEVIEPNRVWVRGGKTYIPICYLTPIPLTAEILFKNGFVSTLSDNGTTYLSEVYKLVIIHRINDEGWSIYSNHFGFDKKDLYVHELQHALKLCGIENRFLGTCANAHWHQQGYQHKQ